VEAPANPVQASARTVSGGSGDHDAAGDRTGTPACGLDQRRGELVCGVDGEGKGRREEGGVSALGVSASEAGALLEGRAAARPGRTGVQRMLVRSGTKVVPQASAGRARRSLPLLSGGARGRTRSADHVWGVILNSRRLLSAGREDGLLFGVYALKEAPG